MVGSERLSRVSGHFFSMTRHAREETDFLSTGGLYLKLSTT
ncbi:hypothetical protein PUN28_018170 [Cardiocondyla obscurior]|uniref:Uncharacterized protein n=1 Tax=Cardiocondyla obscurior TaxID=286306 RepID=A0AAW2EG49_9HYME